MVFEEAFLARLKADAEIARLTGGRIYWVDRPQDKPLPAVVLTLIGGAKAMTMAGAQGLQRTRVQVDVLASSYAVASAIEQAVTTAAEGRAQHSGFQFLQAQVFGPFDRGERTSSGFVHRKQVDLDIPHYRLS